MTLDEFTATLAEGAPPAEAHPVLLALWHDAKGQWAAAHAIAQGEERAADYDRLHAYLHRKDGEIDNARYWYRRAQCTPVQGSLEAEWAELAAKYLG